MQLQLKLLSFCLSPFSSFCFYIPFVVSKGDGKSPVKGDRVVVDWEGYTIGYYGRPFQTRNKVI